MELKRVKGVIVALAVSLVSVTATLWVVTKSTAAIYDRGPIAAYSFDEGEGEVAHDAAGEHDGTIEGPGWSKGKFGQALEFDGEAGDLVTVPNAEDLQLEEFTVEAWVRP